MDIQKHTSAQGQIRIREAVRAARAKKAEVPQLFPGNDGMFHLFVQYYLDELGETENVVRAVGVFFEVIGRLYYPQFGSRPVPSVPPTALIFLRYRRKQHFFWRFPEIARVLFASEAASALIEEFNRQNAFIDSFRIRGSRRPKT